MPCKKKQQWVGGAGLATLPAQLLMDIFFTAAPLMFLDQSQRQVWARGLLFVAARLRRESQFLINGNLGLTDRPIRHPEHLGLADKVAYEYNRWLFYPSTAWVMPGVSALPRLEKEHMPRWRARSLIELSAVAKPSFVTSTVEMVDDGVPRLRPPPLRYALPGYCERFSDKTLGYLWTGQHYFEFQSPKLLLELGVCRPGAWRTDVDQPMKSMPFGRSRWTMEVRLLTDPFSAPTYGMLVDLENKTVRFTVDNLLLLTINNLQPPLVPCWSGGGGVGGSGGLIALPTPLTKQFIKK